MPWTTGALLTLKGELEIFIEQEFGVRPTCPVLLCTSEEMVERIRREPFFLRLPVDEQKILNITLPYIFGKYLRNEHEVWVVDGKGNNKAIMFHELLYSIQQCEPNREGIVDYLTWYFFKDSTMIEPHTLEDWREIERTVGFSQIKQKFLTKGDCEEF